MSQGFREDRRRFLITVGAAGGALALGGGVAGKCLWDGVLGGRLAAVLGDLKAARTIGRAWLEHNPEQRDRGELVRGLLGSLGFAARFAGPEELGRLVAEQIKRDYAEGRMARVGGWILSRTELRLCALAALGEPETSPTPAASPHRAGASRR